MYMMHDAAHTLCAVPDDGSLPLPISFLLRIFGFSSLLFSTEGEEKKMLKKGRRGYKKINLHLKLETVPSALSRVQRI